MEIIIHRVNTVIELQKIKPKYGVEIDIRAWRNNLILNHEPFCKGTDFEEWLNYYDHNFLILNIKEEGIEKKVKELLDKKGITNYFFLDLSFPFLIKLMDSGEKNIAVRFSEYESIDICRLLAGKVNWVWVDCFTRFPLDSISYKKISKHFKICLASPELVGRKEDIGKIKKQIKLMNINAVCTKYPQNWLK